MIITRENERLTLTTWDYNAARTISRLAEIVKENNGKVAPTKPAIISNRKDSPDISPVTVTHTTYISFVLGGFHYYYQVDDNPFFEFYFHKIPTDGRQYDANYYSDEAPKHHFNNDFFYGRSVTSEEIDKAAKNIFSFLVGHKCSQRAGREARIRKIDY